jgi:CubicO group peptidase (beta-lactamase class C family)
LALAALLLSAPAALPAQRLTLARPEEVGLSSQALERIAPAMQTYIDSGRIAGMVIAISRRGKLIYERALGYADIATHTPMRTDAVFVLASARKPLLAAATMSLVDAGRIHLDDPASKYIPSLGRVAVFAGGNSTNPQTRPVSTPITIRHLLTHTSGLASGYLNHPVDTIYNRRLKGTDYSLSAFADTLAAIPLEYEPGTAWRYSRAFEVIGRVLEVASGESLDSVISKRVSTSMGLEATFLHATPEIGSRVATRYVPGPDGKLRVLVGGGRSDGLPTGTMLSTPRDYIRFGNMLLNDGKVGGKQVLSPSSVQQMMRNQLAPALTPISTPVWDHQGYGFGLGGAIRVAPPTEAAPAPPGTYRWPGSSGTFFWVDPANELVAVIFTQSAPGYWLEHQFERLVYDAIK